MKKTFSIIILFVTLFLFTGCSSNSSISNIKYSAFQKKLANKDTFILLVVQDGCSHCANFTPKFDKVLDNYNIKAFSINLAKMADAEKKEFNTNYEIDGTPTVLFFKDGTETSIMNRINGDKDSTFVISKLQTAGYIK